MLQNAELKINTPNVALNFSLWCLRSTYLFLWQLFADRLLRARFLGGSWGQRWIIWPCHMNQMAVTCKGVVGRRNRPVFVKPHAEAQAAEVWFGSFRWSRGEWSLHGVHSVLELEPGGSYMGVGRDWACGERGLEEGTLGWKAQRWNKRVGCFHLLGHACFVC